MNFKIDQHHFQKEAPYNIHGFSAAQLIKECSKTNLKCWPFTEIIFYWGDGKPFLSLMSSGVRVNDELTDIRQHLVHNNFWKWTNGRSREFTRLYSNFSYIWSQYVCSSELFWLSTMPTKQFAETMPQTQAVLAPLPMLQVITRATITWSETVCLLFAQGNTADAVASSPFWLLCQCKWACILLALSWAQQYRRHRRVRSIFLWNSGC